MNQYYCSQKFDWLELRLYDGYVASCCKATPTKLTTNLLATDAQGFFNWPEIINEREMMLRGERVPGCERTCWSQEDQGLPSRRIAFYEDYRHKNKPTAYTEVRQTPRVLNLVVSNTCNLTCSYCCKNFSSTWLRDVIDNGDYNISGYEDRYNATGRDQVLHASSQRLMDQTQIGRMIVDQINANNATIEEITITGGEPLLYSQLESILEMFAHKQITIYSGLGVPSARLKQLLPLLKKYDVLMSISAENTGVYHEFNRYGSAYTQFIENLQSIQQHCRMLFVPTISNLTIFDFPQFMQANPGVEIRPNVVYDPEFFNPCVMDPDSKQPLVDQLGEHSDTLVPILMATPRPELRPQLAAFLTRFTHSRKLSLDIYPESFVQWLYKGEQ